MQRLTPFLSAFLLCIVAKASALNKTTDLSNGAVLHVGLTKDPAVSQATVESIVPIVGEASVGLGAPDVAYIYILDTSGSTANSDGDCGTILDCVQAFMLSLHKEASTNGSAELVAVINFDSDVTTNTGFFHPQNTTVVEDTVEEGVSVGDTYCIKALEAAATLVKDPSNTAGTTVVVFAGDGLCNEDDDDVRAAASALGATGAIVHSVAVGDSVDCDSSTIDYGTEANNMLDIPQNGGVCTSVPDPDTLPAIIDDLIGTTLVSVEVKLDGGNYTELQNGVLSETLPQEGALLVRFNTSATWLGAGFHSACVRATGKDSLGGWSQVEDCQEVEVVNKKLGGGVAASIALSVLVGFAVVVFGLRFYRRAADKQEATPPERQAELPEMA